MKPILQHILLFFLFVFVISTHTKAQWQPCQGLEGSSIGSIITTDTLLFATCGGNGIFSRTLNSDWELSNSNHSGYLIQSDSCIVSFGGMSRRIRSLDMGQTWEEIENVSSDLAFVDEVLFFFSNYWDSVCRSYDYGDTYQVLDYGFESIDKIFSDDSLLFVMDSYSGCSYKTTNYGDSWDTVPHFNFSNFKYDMACYDNTIWLGTSSGAYCLNSEGSQWVEANNSLPENSTVTDFFKLNNDLYCGVDRSRKFTYVKSDGYGWRK